MVARVACPPPRCDGCRLIEQGSEMARIRLTPARIDLVAERFRPLGDDDFQLCDAMCGRLEAEATERKRVLARR